MAIRRGKDGEMIDGPTTSLGNAATGPDGHEAGVTVSSGQNTRSSGGRQLRTGGFSRDYDAPTIKRSDSVPTQGAKSTATAGGEAEDSLDPKTRIARPGQSHRDVLSGETRESGPMDDPPSGWLVVVDGPGKGHAPQLGYGLNSIGRGETVRIRLDHGDPGISRETHCTITYDPKSQRFYVNHGVGVNLTYLDGEPVLQPTELRPHQRLTLGDTTLMFLALCGPEFTWEDSGARPRDGAQPGSGER